MEAVMKFCDENRIDVEEVLPLIGRTLKEKIRVDAENAGYMKTKSARLPVWTWFIIWPRGCIVLKLKHGETDFQNITPNTDTDFGRGGVISLQVSLLKFTVMKILLGQ